jgi:hypothetical protein
MTKTGESSLGTGRITRIYYFLEFLGKETKIPLAEKVM